MFTKTLIADTKNIRIDMTINPRDPLGSSDTSYDIAGMRLQFETDGRMTNPPILEEMADGTLRVLQGFQRMLAANDVLADNGEGYPETLTDDKGNVTHPRERFLALKESLQKILVVVKSDLSDEEREEIVNDHGQNRGLTRVETIKLIWAKYSVMGYDKLCVRFYTLIAKLSTQAEQDNLREKLSKEKAGTKGWKNVVTTHFRGEVNDKILTAFTLGPRVQKCFIEWNSGRKDGAEFNPSRTNLAMIKEARNRDMAKDASDGRKKGEEYKDWNPEFDGRGWSQKDGGNNFNAVIDRLASIKRGDTTDDTKSKSLTKKEMEERIPSTKSKIGQVVYKIAAGGDKLSADEKNFFEIDSNAEALESIQAFIRSKLDKINSSFGPEFAAMFSAIAYTAGTSAGFEKAFSSLEQKAEELAKEPVKEPVAIEAPKDESKKAKQGKR